MKGPKAARSLLDRSGFPLELRVEHEIRSREAEHGWQIEGRDHFWQRVDSEGYLDFVIRRNHLVVALECKRTKDDWAFLVGRDRVLVRSHAVGLKVDRDKPGNLRVGWTDLPMSPSSPEASLVATNRSEEVMLEHFCRPLLSATDALASAEIREATREAREAQAIYLAAIVTNATLWVAHVEPAEQISLEDGCLSDDVEPQEAPMVRFRKPLGADTDFRDELNGERTIFVINASALAGVLRGLST